ncbi:MAG TPA: hypothetical protein VNC41_03755, partial [Acidimicrobiia bacterium]|nr:hypothetical protein [Acidimicrobiia bacterium]
PPEPAPARSSSSTGMVVAAVVVVLAISAAAYLFARGGDTAGTSGDAPVVLSPNEPMKGGIVGSLSDAVRVQAESNRQTALSAVMQTQAQNGRGVDRALLHQAQPDFEWLDPSTSSSGPKEISIGETDDGIVIAISASNKTVCAFGHLPMAGGGVAEYVTMGNMSSCAATDAPTEGWSELAGGYGGTPPLDG